MFEGRGCSWCARWHAEIGPGYHKTEEGRRAPLRRLDIRQQENAGALLARSVTVTPTFVLIDDGREVGRLVGYPGGEFFYGLLDELLSRLPQPAGADTSAPGRGTASACVGDARM
jgi:thioredoxin-related protein